MSSTEIFRRTLLAASLLMLAGPLAAASPFKPPVETPAFMAAKAAVSPLTAITAAGARLVAIGQRGIVLVSDDSGRGWTQVPFPVSSDLTAVWFASDTDGWIVGQDGVVLHSSDGGNSWSKQADGRSLPKEMLEYYGRLDQSEPDIQQAYTSAEYMVQDGDYKPFLDVWFRDAATGFIIGEFGMIFKTTDGGNTWQPWQHRVENPQVLHLHQMREINGELFIVGERGLLLKYDAEEERFVMLGPVYDGSFMGVTGNSDMVVVYGMRGHAYRSRDGGETWARLVTNTNALITGGVVLDDGRIVMSTDSRALLVSEDGGDSFRPVTPPNAMAWYGVSQVSGQASVALVGSRGVRVEQVVRGEGD